MTSAPGISCRLARPGSPPDVYRPLDGVGSVAGADHDLPGQRMALGVCRPLDRVAVDAAREAAVVCQLVSGVGRDDRAVGDEAVDEAAAELLAPPVDVEADA